MNGISSKIWKSIVIIVSIITNLFAVDPFYISRIYIEREKEKDITKLLSRIS